MVVGRRDAFSALQCNLDKFDHSGLVVCHENDWLLGDGAVLVGRQNGVATLDLFDRSGFAHRTFAIYNIHECACNEAVSTLRLLFFTTRFWTIIFSINDVLLVSVAMDLILSTILINTFLILTRWFHNFGFVVVGHAYIDYIYISLI